MASASLAFENAKYDRDAQRRVSNRRFSGPIAIEIVLEIASATRH
jgi:hypothetical protein